MKKYILFYLLTTINFLHAQELKLTFPFPEIRKGKEIQVDYFLKNQYDNQNEIKGSVVINSPSKDTGSIVIGPFTLTINGKTFTSDSAKIRVIEPLPNVTSGVWLHLVDFYGSYFLIIEQKIESDEKQHEFVSIKDNIKKDGIRFSFVSSNESSNNFQDKDGFFKTVKSKITSVQIIKDLNFKGKFKIEKQYFNNIPENFDFPLLIISE